MANLGLAVLPTKGRVSIGDIIAQRKTAQTISAISPAKNASATSFTASANDGTTGTDDYITNPHVLLTPYKGIQQNQGRATYNGLKPQPIVLKVVEAAGGGTGDTFVIFDFDGLSGKANSTGVSISLTSSTLTGANGYTAINKLYAQKHPLFKEIRMSVDAKAQLDYQYTVQYFDENSNSLSQLNFIPSSAIVQEDNQTTLAAMGLEFGVTPNCVFYGKIDNNSNAGYNSMTLYTLGYVWDNRFV